MSAPTVGDVSANSETFCAEFEDYALVTGLMQKEKLVQAATLRTVMEGRAEQ